MNEFHYDYIKSTYGNNSRLLFIDTDIWHWHILYMELKLQILMKVLVSVKK